MHATHTVYYSMQVQPADVLGMFHYTNSFNPYQTFMQSNFATLANSLIIKLTSKIVISDLKDSA